MNKYVPHLIIIPEDEADERIANGFTQHDQVKTTRVSVARKAGGWREVVKRYCTEYIPYLTNFDDAHVVMLIDFDTQYVQRRAEVEQSIPAHLKRRTFVIGAAETPERLKAALADGGFEEIGRSLAEGCPDQANARWGHLHLAHNAPDLARLSNAVRGFLF